MNKVVQNRLLNDIIRFKIKTYDELNKWFNDYYIDYDIIPTQYKNDNNNKNNNYTEDVFKEK